jgi:hypothetical protein
MSPDSFLDLIFPFGSVSGAGLQLPTVFLSSRLHDSFCLLGLSGPVKLTSWIWLEHPSAHLFGDVPFPAQDFLSGARISQPQEKPPV